MAPQSLQSPSRCKPGARWRHNRYNPLPAANLPLGGTTIAAVPILLQTCHQVAPQSLQSPSILVHWHLLEFTPWWPIWAPPGGKVAMACPHHPPKFQPNWPTYSWEIALFILWEPPWWPIWAPPGGKAAMVCPHLPPKFQPNGPIDSWEIETWWRSEWQSCAHIYIQIWKKARAAGHHHF